MEIYSEGKETVNFKFNSTQTNITSMESLNMLILKTLGEEELDKSFLQEVRLEFLDTYDSIKFVKNLSSPDRKRARDLKRWDNPYSKTRKEDPNGRIEVDLTNPHILEDMDFFREAAIRFKDTGTYTHLYPDSNPYSEYSLFWKEEARRCREGLIRPSDGEWIPGYFYFYLNYTIIQLTEMDENMQVSTRVENFPHLYDGDYIFFHYLEKARRVGKHTATLKKRGAGFSYKGGSKMARNFILGETWSSRKKTTSFAIAEEKEYLIKDGVLNKFLDTANFCAIHTPFPRVRELKDSMNEMQWVMGYRDKATNKPHGTLNSVMGVTLKNDPNRARGKRGILIEWEEVGSFNNFLKSWTIARPSVEQDNVTFGLMNAYGCLTAGNKVWDNEGNLVNIEDLDIKKGIVGYEDNKGFSKENITYWQPPAKKQCVKITTNSGRSIECSVDHPILWSKSNYGSQPRINGKRPFIKKTKFVEAENISIGDQVAIIDKVDIWSDKEMWNPRLVGLLIGDGSYGFDKTPVLASCDKEINDYIVSNFEHIVEKESITKDGKLYKEIRIKGICQNLREIGIYGQTKNNKRLPLNIHSYSKNTVCELLGGLFDADGYYSDKGKYPEINLTSSCKELLLEVQLLCNKLGVHGNISKIKPSKKSTFQSKENYYRFYIRNKVSLERFLSLISSQIGYKIQSANNIASKLKNIKSGSSKSITGLQFERVVKIENTGLQTIYNLTAGKTHTYIGNGIVTHNTGGEEGKGFEGLEEIFYSPKGYGVLSMYNVFDRNTDEKSKKCAFFFPQYLNAKHFYDENGNSNVIGALIQIICKRINIKYNTLDPNAIVQEKAERPITPQEAIMRTEGSAFPTGALKELLESIKPNYTQFISEHYVGELIEGKDGVEWNPKASLNPLRSFPTKDISKAEGAIEIFEMPKYEIRGSNIRYIRPFRYIAGCDPVDNDYTKNGSLASIFVFDTWTDRIVAEYTGRPVLASEFYDKCILLCKFYNATLNYENNLKGLFGHFSNNNCVHLLCDTPQYLRDMELVRDTFTGNRSKGTRTTSEISKVGKTLQREWQLSKHSYLDENEEEQVYLNYEKIRSIAYIEECISWNPDGNFDRVSAMDMVMIYRQDILKMSTSHKEDDYTNFNTGDDFIDKNWNKYMSGSTQPMDSF